MSAWRSAVDRGGGWPSLRRLRGHLERHGHVAVPLPAAAAARAGELLLTVPTLLRDAAHVQALDELADDMGRARRTAGTSSSWGARAAARPARRQVPPPDHRRLRPLRDGRSACAGAARAPCWRACGASGRRPIGCSPGSPRRCARPCGPTSTPATGACRPMSTRAPSRCCSPTGRDRCSSPPAAAGRRCGPSTATGWHAVVLPGTGRPPAVARPRPVTARGGTARRRPAPVDQRVRHRRSRVVQRGRAASASAEQRLRGGSGAADREVGDRADGVRRQDAPQQSRPAHLAVVAAREVPLGRRDQHRLHARRTRGSSPSVARTVRTNVAGAPRGHRSERASPGRSRPPRRWRPAGPPGSSSGSSSRSTRG